MPVTGGGLGPVRAGCLPLGGLPAAGEGQEASLGATGGAMPRGQPLVRCRGAGETRRGPHRSDSPSLPADQGGELVLFGRCWTPVRGSNSMASAWGRHASMSPTVRVGLRATSTALLSTPLGCCFGVPVRGLLSGGRLGASIVSSFRPDASPSRCVMSRSCVAAELRGLIC